jgi:serine/threonine protein kinase
MVMLTETDILPPATAKQVGNFSKPHRVCEDCYKRLTLQDNTPMMDLDVISHEVPHTPPLSLKHSENIHFDYTFGDKLGEGSFGIVFGVIQNSSGHPFALKQIERAKLAPEDDASVKSEVHILSNLHHPNIVALLDFYIDPEHYYMVMERVDGGELFDRIVSKSFYSEKQARDVVRVILCALKYLHDKNVVHRDLKPENLMMTHKTDDADVKLVDFGFATVANGFSLTEACGTPAYVAPEILEGKHYGKPVDMWSFGVILYILLCGGPPFYAKDQQVLFKKIMHGKFSFDLERWKNISNHAKDLISKLLTVNPIRRLSVDEALQHEWLTAHDSYLEGKTLTDGLVQLKKFQVAKKFKAGVRAVLAANRLNFGLLKILREQSRQEQEQAGLHATNSNNSINPVANIPHTIDARYTMGATLGEGGYAIVKLGINKLNKDEVAIKIFNTTKMNPTQKKYLKEEVDIMKAIVHPNVVRYYDFFDEEPTHNYLVMEKIAGGELFDRVVRKQKYNEKEAQDLARVLLQAIKYLHEKNIVHRDLKPENLLMNSESNDADVKIVDFGFATFAENFTLTRYCGTLGYMVKKKKLFFIRFFNYLWNNRLRKS